MSCCVYSLVDYAVSIWDGSSRAEQEKKFSSAKFRPVVPKLLESRSCNLYRWLLDWTQSPKFPSWSKWRNKWLSGCQLLGCSCETIFPFKKLNSRKKYRQDLRELQWVQRTACLEGVWNTLAPVMEQWTEEDVHCGPAWAGSPWLTKNFELLGSLLFIKPLKSRDPASSAWFRALCLAINTLVFPYHCGPWWLVCIPLWILSSSSRGWPSVAGDGQGLS